MAWSRLGPTRDRPFRELSFQEGANAEDFGSRWADQGPEVDQAIDDFGSRSFISQT